ncbi:GNAT family N-acetyltransferase [Flindersiella endophytica]
MVIRVVPVDLADEETFRTWYDVYREALTFGRPEPFLPARDDLRLMLTPSSASRTEVWLALYDDQPAGGGGIQLPLLDNPQMAFFAIGVAPGWRRRGIGAALYDHTLERARAEGRTSLVCQLEVAPEDLETAPGVSFLRKRGLTARNTLIRRRLRLPVPRDRLDLLEARAAERLAGYQLLTWVGACPQEYVEEYAKLKGLLSVEQPQGDLEMEEEKWDAARLRETEERSAASGESRFVTVAVAPDGSLAGHTVIGVQDSQNPALQYDTLVLRAHRGHRLGLALKVANLRTLQAAHGDLRSVLTSNAEQNAAMVKINVDVGFEIIEIEQLWQGNLP